MPPVASSSPTRRGPVRREFDQLGRASTRKPNRGVPDRVGTTHTPCPRRVFGAFGGSVEGRMDTPTASVADERGVGWRFDNTYARLPDHFFVRATPATVREP